MRTGYLIHFFLADNIAAVHVCVHVCVQKVLTCVCVCVCAEIVNNFHNKIGSVKVNKKKEPSESSTEFSYQKHSISKQTVKATPYNTIYSTTTSNLTLTPPSLQHGVDYHTTGNNSQEK